jgi:hypothetical protein
MDVVEPPLELTGTGLHARNRSRSHEQALEWTAERHILEPGRMAGRS